ncbi:MAG: thymidine phosphorylase [Eubacteriales bacterium]|nr:thymidine phosphorylase [Eubacteriales bacterium]
MDILSIIEKKATGQELTKDEINFFIQGVCDGSLPDYQISSLLMAIRLKGMSKAETFALTEAMLNSGDKLDLSSIKGVKCDKHSTGGVGDKTSLVLCPMVASLGIKVAKMSGRGLGFTGGTLDKLESIPGMRTELSDKEFLDAVNNVGMAIVSQSKNLDPADKKLYALRDVTGTVDSMPLIASSIMSKKLAAGCDCILLDVKYGSGAFMETKEKAETLAKLMVEIGTHFGKNTQAEISSMNQPLGKAIGNILEVEEAIATLHGNGPKDFTDLCLSSGATMLLQSGIFHNRAEAIHALEKTLEEESAYKVFRAFVHNQGGDITYIDDPKKFPVARYSVPVRSVKEGYISEIDTRQLGLTSVRLGAGREKLGDAIDPAAGIVLSKKLGEKVSKGDVLLTLYSERPGMQSLVSQMLNLFEFSDSPIVVPSTVEERIRLDDVTKSFVIEKEA